MKKNWTILIIFGLILSVIFPFPTTLLSTIHTSKGLSGEIAGLNYSYGMVPIQESGNFTIQETGSIDERFSNSTTTITELELITNINFTNVLFQLHHFIFFPNGTNSTYTSWLDMPGLDELGDYVNNTLPSIIARDPKANVTEGYYTDKDTGENVTLIDHHVPVISTDDEFLGAVPANMTFAEYIDGTNSTDIYYHAILLNPEAIIVEVEKETHMVWLNHTVIAANIFWYGYRYSMEYTIDASAFVVNVNDGENFAIQVAAFNNLNANYKEVIYSGIGYYQVYYEFTEIFYLNSTGGKNESAPVPFENYPRYLFPRMIQNQGQIQEVGVQDINLQAASTLQSVVAAFLSRSSNASLQYGGLAVWGVQTSPILVGYQDGNNNDYLDISLADTGLEVDPNDRIKYIGFEEAYQIDAAMAHKRTHTYNTSLKMPAYGVDYNETNVNDTEFNYAHVSYGIGDPNMASDPDWYWNDPTESNGVVTFEFGVNYTDFPVTWVNMSDGSRITDQEDVKYDYILIVDTNNGQADLSPTLTCAGVNNSTLKGDLTGIDLSRQVISEFFALEAIYSVSEEQTGLNATRTSAFAIIEVSNDQGEEYTAIDTSDAKTTYSLSGLGEYNATFGAINLLTIKGAFRGEQVTPFRSESQETGGTAMLTAKKQQFAVNFLYSADLFIVNYPEWNGTQIIHDPSYKTFYEAMPEIPEVQSPIIAFVLSSLILITIPVLFRKRK
ncbi:MAG: hypothetical protein ACFFCQ_08625 [Promethearchaeota archaeon]